MSYEGRVTPLRNKISEYQPVLRVSTEHCVGPKNGGATFLSVRLDRLWSRFGAMTDRPAGNASPPRCCLIDIMIAVVTGDVEGDRMSIEIGRPLVRLT